MKLKYWIKVLSKAKFAKAFVKSAALMRPIIELFLLCLNFGFTKHIRSAKKMRGQKMLNQKNARPKNAQPKKCSTKKNLLQTFIICLQSSIIGQKNARPSQSKNFVFFSGSLISCQPALIGESQKYKYGKTSIIKSFKA